MATVLHVNDRGGDLDRYFLTSAFLGRGGQMEIHVTEHDGGTTIYSYREVGGRTAVRVSCNDPSFGCGCP